MSNIYISDKELWERPFTTKRYLHPPFAEEMATMWAQFMFMLGDIYEKNDQTTPSAAIRFLHGDVEEFDFKKVIYKKRDDGIPVHGFSFNENDYLIEAESFCDICVSPTVFIKVKIKNTALWEVKDTLCIAQRTGKENFLHGMNDIDGYCSHNPNIRIWGNVPRTWVLKDSILTDGKYTFNMVIPESENISVRWQGEEEGLPWYKRRILKIDFCLDAGEECEFFFALKKGEASEFNYKDEKEKCLTYWQNEIKKIKIYPSEKKDYKALVNSLVCQCLQMFCHHVGKYDYVLPRQGGLQRNIWVGEAYAFLMALDRIGDFYSYTERAYSLFFDVLQEKEGENKGMIKTLEGSIPWASITGSAIKGLSYHIIKRNDKKIFDKYKEDLYSAFLWAEKTRKAPRPEGCIEGIMPPMRSCDWEAVVQDWTRTDSRIIEGYIETANCFSFYNDSRADEIKKATENYKECMRSIMKITKNTFENNEEALYCAPAGTVITDPTVDTLCSSDSIFLAHLGIIEHDGEEMRKIKNYYKNRCLIENGLHLTMHASGTHNNPWSGYTKYTSTADSYWFYHYMAINDKKMAWETLKGQLKYSMTEEFYMLERYASNDPYYVPWLPNASANGRLINMLCDWFEV